MSLIGAGFTNRTREEVRKGRAADEVPPGVDRGGGVMTTMFNPDIHLWALTRLQDCVEILPIQKVQSRNFKTACFVFCSFHCLVQNRKYTFKLFLSSKT